MHISEINEAYTALSTIGYYRLKGYSFQWIDSSTLRYFPGTEFSNVLALYRFDSELSHLIFEFLSQIEVSLRARLVNALQCTSDPLILNDSSMFNIKASFWKNMSNLSSEIERSTDVFIKHNFDNHDGAIPVWAAVEVSSFGTLSKILKNLKTVHNAPFSILIQDYRFSNGIHEVTPSHDMFTSWVQSLTVIRNICAHNGRIYNRAISTRPQLISTDIPVSTPRFYGAYQIILAMKYLRPSDHHWTLFVARLKDLFTKYSGVFEFTRLNFPEDWESHL